VIFSAGEAEAKVIGSRGAGPYWTPTQSQVDQAERALPAFLKTKAYRGAPEIAAGLDEYLRQYAGLTVRGQKTLMINAWFL
jgi:hypothetical protein